MEELSSISPPIFNGNPTVVATVIAHSLAVHLAGTMGMLQQ